MPEHTVLTKTVLGRRDWKPLFSRAGEALRAYEEATGAATVVLDQDGKSASGQDAASAFRFCEPCGNPVCAEMHRAAIRRACRTGDIYIYKCAQSHLFWTVPLLSNGRSPGAFLAGINPEKNPVQVRALADLLLIAVKWISRFSRGSGSPEKAGCGKIREEHAAGEKGIYLIRRDDPAPWPAEKERAFLASLSRGDGEVWRKNLSALTDFVQNSQPQHFEETRRRVMELSVLLSRSAMSGGSMGTWSPVAQSSAKKISGAEIAEILENGNRTIQRMEEAPSAKELAAILRHQAEQLSSKIFSFRGVRHASALRRAERFIRENYTRKISLEEIAGASGLSGPYFSSIFREETGEKLSNYLNRLRVEHAAQLLSETDVSLADISVSCGFEDQSWFSKIFRSFTGLTPGKFREQGHSGVFDEKFGMASSRQPDNRQLDNRQSGSKLSGTRHFPGEGENSKETG